MPGQGFVVGGVKGMPKLEHRKSRGGCQRCKKRKVKVGFLLWCLCCAAFSFRRLFDRVGVTTRLFVQ